MDEPCGRRVFTRLIMRRANFNARLLPQQRRQFHYVRRDPPRLIFGQQLASLLIYLPK